MSSISFAVFEQRARRRRLLLAADQVRLGDPLGLDDLVQKLAHVARQDHVLDADLADLGAEIRRSGGYELAHLPVDGVAGGQDLVERARRDRLADRELHEPVERARDVGGSERRLLGIDDHE